MCAISTDLNVVEIKLEEPLKNRAGEPDFGWWHQLGRPARKSAWQADKQPKFNFLLWKYPLLRVMQHNSFPVRQMAAGAEPPQVRRLLKYLLPARTGITRLPLTPACRAAGIMECAETSIILTKTLACSEGRAPSVKDQGSISVSTRLTIRSCYRSAWCCLIACNRVRNTNVDLLRFVLMGQCLETWHLADMLIVSLLWKKSSFY